jgi:hypothetical protein
LNYLNSVSLGIENIFDLLSENLPLIPKLKYKFRKTNQHRAFVDVDQCSNHDLEKVSRADKDTVLLMSLYAEII